MLLFCRRAIGTITKIRSGQAHVRVGPFDNVFKVPLKNGTVGAHVSLTFKQGQPTNPVLLKRPHVCRSWSLLSHTGPLEVTLTCQACGARRVRKATKQEALVFKQDQRRFQSESDKAHAVWHDFCKRFKPAPDNVFKYTGYDFISRVEKWARKFPKDVRIVPCDDDYFASSILVLIEHQAPTFYMGTSVVCIPQLSGDPTCMFLYPRHRSLLLAGLLAIQKVSRGIEAKQEARRRERGQVLQALFKKG